MTPEKILELMKEVNAEALKMDGFDDAIIGIADRFGMPSVFLYDWQKCIDVLTSDGLSYQEAEEYLEFNCIGAWMGDNTPAFANMSSEMY